MGIITRMRKQSAVLWSYLGEDSNGDPTWDAPEQILVRWEDKEGDGEAFAQFRAGVYVGKDLIARDHLLLGELGSSTSSDPEDEESWEVVGFSKLPDLRAKEFLRQVTITPTARALLARGAPGVDWVTYWRVATASTSASGRLTRTGVQTSIIAHKGQPTLLETDRERGNLVLESVFWNVPKAFVRQAPAREDYIEDADGRRWNVLRWEPSGIPSWWRVLTRGAS
jgi:hypothetical protein